MTLSGSMMCGGFRRHRRIQVEIIHRVGRVHVLLDRLDLEPPRFRPGSPPQPPPLVYTISNTAPLWPPATANCLPRSKGPMTRAANLFPWPPPHFSPTTPPSRTVSITPTPPITASIRRCGLPPPSTTPFAGTDSPSGAQALWFPPSPSLCATSPLERA